MLPLRETAALLGQPLLGGAGQVQIGRLSIDTARNRALLAGAPQIGAVATLGGVLILSAAVQAAWVETLSRMIAVAEPAA